MSETTKMARKPRSWEVTAAAGGEKQSFVAGLSQHAAWSLIKHHCRAALAMGSRRRM